METNNYTLTKLIRTGISPICAMIGTSVTHPQRYLRYHKKSKY
ncbi:hypothetical protein [Spiroplasma endosymbiont of Phycita roborella]